MSEEFGPWIEHDGRGCPVMGQLFQSYFEECAGHETLSDIRVAKGGASWFWGVEADGLRVCRVAWAAPIIRYRVKKPKGLTILENLIAEIPEEVAG